jgi:HD-like signal output (HDOD) protein
MNDSRFRLIFEGLEQSAQVKKLVAFFRKELGMSGDRIRSMLTNPPRVVWEVSTRNRAELIQTALQDLGCHIYLEPVIADSSYPFVISVKHQEVMNRELSKILRCRCNLSVFLVQVTTSESQSILPSMMGPFEKELAEHFRLSDTVVGIDDSRIIILGFSTGREGSETLQNKINRVLKELLGQDVLITVGFSLFPGEARSLPGLIYLAEVNRKKGDDGESRDTEIAFSPQPSTAFVSARDEARLNPLQLCFTQARGKVLKRLLDMDPQTLWLGLSQVPQAEQKKFLARLPFDSPLIPVLEKTITTQPESLFDKTAEQHFEALVHQMQLEEGLERRKEIQEEVLSRLNRLETLPTLPSVAAHVFQIASNPNSSASDLTKVIMNDPSLTSKILKVVNSAFYGFPQKIGTVNQAVVVLGTNEIMDLAFGVAAAKAFDVTPVEGLFDPKAVWHHSICTGLIAQNLCQRVPEYEKQKLGGFTAGLLHDFGKIFLAQGFHELYTHIHVESRKHELPLFELEEERFGLNHALIGKLLASNWNLPEYLVQAIAFHHQPFSASSHSQLAAIIGLADYLYYEATISEGQRGETSALFPQLTSGHWSVLTQLFTDLDTEQMEKMKDDALTVFTESDDLFEIID